MRTLLILRGAPGSGKSTWVNDNHLKEYTVSSDDIRLLLRSPEYNKNGDLIISQKDMGETWTLIESIIRSRMKKGCFTVLDATNIKTKDIKIWQKLAREYEYKLVCVDFTDVPLNVLLERNKERSKLKRISEDAICKIYENIQTNILPSSFNIIKPNEFHKVFLKPLDLSNYKKIHCIGDIHGCYKVLKEYIEEIKDDECYIFTGDYLDRGFENAEVFKFMNSIAEKQNVFLIEGNHEKWLKNFVNSENDFSNEFEKYTIPDLQKANITLKEIKHFTKNLIQCAYFTYNGNTFFASHGGVGGLNRNPIFISTSELVKGSGDSYSDIFEVQKAFVLNEKDIYQIHGHRNHGSEINPNPFTFNLNGDAENGNELRILELEGEKITPIEKENVCYKREYEDVLKSKNIEKVVNVLRKDKYILEKKFGNISSFNFTREAFTKNLWNDRTITARGLYIDTKNMRIAARGYNKFFVVGQRENTSVEDMCDKFTYPLNIYLKENGFLGIIGVDDNNELLITTKSNPEGNAAKYLKNIFSEKVPEEIQEKIKEYLIKNNSTMLFECVDMKNDPHIIEYPENQLILLDIIKNEFEFSKLPYNQLCEIAKEFNLDVKKKTHVINNKEEWLKWNKEIAKENYKYNGKYIEGFVIEDATGFTQKTKTFYYKKWKRYRGLMRINMENNNFKLEKFNENELEFIKFVNETYYDKTKLNIMKVRKDFENRERVL